MSGNATLFILFAWNMIEDFHLFPKVPGTSPVPGRCLLYYILVPSFFIDFYLVLHSGKASQIHIKVIDLVLCSVGSVFFPLRSERSFCYCNNFLSRLPCLPSSVSRSHLCLRHSSSSAPSLPGLPTPFLHRSYLLNLSKLFFWFLE